MAARIGCQLCADLREGQGRQLIHRVIFDKIH